MGMKLLILLFALILASSCQKELSQEGMNNGCGTIVAVNFTIPHRLSIDVKFGWQIVNLPIGVWDLQYYKVGDTFCK